jgi:hypothetical protein
MAVLTEVPDFKNGSGIDAQTLTDVAETAIDANKKSTNISTSPNSDEAGNIGQPNVSIDANGHLKFSNLKGEKGEKGVSITKVEKTASAGLTDTYTITFSDSTTSTFSLTNGANGTDGKDGLPPTINSYSYYQAGKTYYHNSTQMDIVYYGGSSYVPKNASVANIVPTNSDYWSIIAQKGQDGIGGNVSANNNASVDISGAKLYAFTPSGYTASTGRSELDPMWSSAGVFMVLSKILIWLQALSKWKSLVALSSASTRVPCSRTWLLSPLLQLNKGNETKQDTHILQNSQELLVQPR